jgi:predicted amidohydrolase
MPQIKALKLLPYQNYIVAIISVRVKTLKILLCRAALQHLVYRFQCFSQRTRRSNHCSLFEKRMAGVYHNSAYIIDTDGSEAGLYRKMHIPDDPHFYEKFYFPEI